MSDEDGLPLPIVLEVLEVHDHQYFSKWKIDQEGFFVLIAPDHQAGRKHRYSAISIDYATGQAITIGRELPLKFARKIARKPTPSRKSKS